MEAENYSVTETETEIDLIDLARFCAMRWRRILAGMAAGGLALLAVGAAMNAIAMAGSGKNVEIEKKEQEVSSAREELMDSAKDEEEGERLVSEVENSFESYLLLDEKKSIREEYMEKSVRMRLDPQKVPRMVTQYYISGNKNVRNIITSLSSFSLDDSEYAKAARLLGMDASDFGYVSELVSISDRSDTSYYQLYSGNLQEERGGAGVEGDTSSVMFLSATGVDRQSCEGVMEILKNAVMARKEQLEGVYGSFSIAEIGSSFHEELNLGLREEQQSNLNELNVLGQQLITFEDSVKEGEDYFKALAGLEKAKRTAQEEEEEKGLFRIIRSYIRLRFILIGMLLGAFCVCGWYACRYIFNGSIKTGGEIQAAYGIPLIREYRYGGPAKGKGLPGMLDRWIQSWGRKEAQADAAVTDALVAAELVPDLMKREARSVCIISSPAEGPARETAQRLKAALEKSGVKAVAGASASADPESMGLLSGSDSVLFVEEAHAALRQDLEKDIAACRRFGVYMSGAVSVAAC